MATSQLANAYLATRVMTASPEELRLMLLDGAIKFARQGRDGLVARNFEVVHHGFSRCRAILLELVTSMRPEVDPSLCERLSSLYMFMFRELLESAHSKDAARADKVIELLEYDRETWVLLMQKLGQEQRAAATLRAEHALDTDDRAPLSISG